MRMSLYIHIPFCQSKCHYCDFASFAGKEHFFKEYVDCLCKEIKERANFAKNYEIETIFVGGGTPSILPVELLAPIFKVLKENYRIMSNAEITIECNPGTLTKEKAIGYLALGINRISLGLQSTNNKLLKMLGRIHTYETFLSNYNMLREIGFKNINIDLMSGLPNQSVLDWEKDINRILDLEPEHISAYSLIIEEHTPFHTLYEKGNLNLLCEEDEREMYHKTKTLLQENGYERYEISNYAKEGFSCQHNLNYWNGTAYLGFGLGAHSYLNKKRFYNTSILNEYIEKIKMDESVVEDTQQLSMENLYEEFMFLGLRKMKGISQSVFKEKFHKDINEVFGGKIQTLIHQELLEETGDWIKLTEKGIDVSNQVFVEFLLD